MGLVYLQSTYMWLMFYGKHRKISYHTWILWARGICHNQDQQNFQGKQPATTSCWNGSPKLAFRLGKHAQTWSTNVKKKYFKRMVAVSFNDNDSYRYVLTEWRTILHNNFPKSLCQLHAVCACLKWSVAKRPIRLHCFLLTSTSPSGQINNENTEAYKGIQRYCISHLGIKFKFAYLKTHFLQANPHMTASTPRESAQHFLVLCDLLATKYKSKQAIRYHCPYEHQWMLLYFSVAFVKTHFLQANLHTTASTPRESAQHFLVLCDLLATKYKTKQAIRYHSPYEHQWMLLYFPVAFVKTHFLQANLLMTASTPRESA